MRAQLAVALNTVAASSQPKSKLIFHEDCQLNTYVNGLTAGCDVQR